MLGLISRLFRYKYHFKSKASALGIVIAFSGLIACFIYVQWAMWYFKTNSLTKTLTAFRLTIPVIYTGLALELIALLVVIPLFNRRLRKRALHNYYLICPSCGYDCSTIPDFTACPECGLTANADAFREIWTNPKAR